MNGRDAILAAVREALADHPTPPPIPRGYRLDADPGVDVVALFAERVADYRATVHRATEAELPALIAEILDRVGARSVVVSPDAPASWLSATGLEPLVDDPPLSREELDAAGAVVTGSALAIAETGTIVLDGGIGQGRRAISLLPDHHVCVVDADAIVATVPRAVARLTGVRPLTWISGPSATSDIELQRVEGVHGPRHLHVVIVHSAEPVSG